MEKGKVRFIMTITREYEIDLKDYKMVKGVNTIEDAAKLDVHTHLEDPFMFIDIEGDQCNVEYEILEKEI